MIFFFFFFTFFWCVVAAAHGSHNYTLRASQEGQPNPAVLHGQNVSASPQSCPRSEARRNSVDLPRSQRFAHQWSCFYIVAVALCGIGLALSLPTFTHGSPSSVGNHKTVDSKGKDISVWLELDHNECCLYRFYCDLHGDLQCELACLLTIYQ